jgi:hypothetical protein
VRNREERKKMHGGDCECCRDVGSASLMVRLTHTVLRSHRPAAALQPSPSVEGRPRSRSRSRGPRRRLQPSAGRPPEPHLAPPRGVAQTSHAA